MNRPKYVMNRPRGSQGAQARLNSHPSFPFCKRVSRFGYFSQISFSGKQPILTLAILVYISEK